MDIEQTLKEYRNLKANTKKNSVNNDKIVSRSIVKVVKEKIYVLWTILKVFYYAYQLPRKFLIVKFV